MKILQVLIGFLLIFGIALGCSPSDSDAPRGTSAQLDSSLYLLTSEPETSLGVREARESVDDEDQIIVVGRIGGALNPWVDDRAAFQIVDTSLKACSDDKPEGAHTSCPTPWDYCCESDKLPTSMALVQFADEDGKVLKQDARSLFDVVELQTVFVQGMARRDDAGNLTIVADRMFIKQ